MATIETKDAVCIRPGGNASGSWWQAVAGSESGAIIRSELELEHLVTWLRRVYPREPLVILPPGRDS